MKVDGEWVPTFPNASYLFGRVEHEHWARVASREDMPHVMADSVTPIVDAGLATLVEYDHTIGAEISLLPTVGHTPGHVSVMIASRGERAMITGDFMHHPCQIAHPGMGLPPPLTRTRNKACEHAGSCSSDHGSRPFSSSAPISPAATAGPRIVRDGEISPGWTS